jgi:hypothetical protein
MGPAPSWNEKLSRAPAVVSVLARAVAGRANRVWALALCLGLVIHKMFDARTRTFAGGLRRRALINGALSIANTWKNAFSFKLVAFFFDFWRNDPPATGFPGFRGERFGGGCDRSAGLGETTFAFSGVKGQ